MPTATVVTAPFGFKARREVEALGVAELPIVVLPHPIGQLPAEDMVKITDSYIVEIVNILTASPDQLKATYTDHTSSEPSASTAAPLAPG